MKRQKIRYIVIVISFLLFPITIYYFSPILIIMGALEGIITGSFILFASQFLLSLLFGRIYCGWLCPVAGVQEACFRANDRQVGGYRWIKFLIWVPWIAGIVLAFRAANGFTTVSPLYLIPGGISVSEPSAYFIYYIVVGIIVILALAVGRRAFCHYVCWMAPFMIAGTKLKSAIGWPSLCLWSDPAKCTKCGQCVKKCPMSLNVQNMVQQRAMANTDCILCGECIDVCPKQAIHYSLRPQHTHRISEQIRRQPVG